MIAGLAIQTSNRHGSRRGWTEWRESEHKLFGPMGKRWFWSGQIPGKQNHPLSSWVLFTVINPGFSANAGGNP